MAEKRDKMLENFRKKRVEAGDTVIVEEGLLNEYCKDPHRDVTVKVKKVLDNGSIVVCNIENYRDNVTLTDGDYELDIFNVGADPFPEKSWRSDIRTVNYDLSCILGKFGVHVWRKGAEVRKYEPYAFYKNVQICEVNYNPYVLDADGNKMYYQRDWCWTLEQKQLFIESIYQSINCGMVIVRKRSTKWIEEQINNGSKDVAYSDIVDGKQRIGALVEFVLDGYTDLHGNYFSDLSEKAKVKFCNSMALTYAELGENATDEDTISAFLGVNFTGVPMSKEHIEYVQKIQNKLSLQ